MRRFLGFTGLILAFALGTWVAWWTVPLVALLWALIPPARPATLSAALAAAAAWGLWLGYDLVTGGSGLGRLTVRLAALMHLPSPLLILLVLVFPALLAACAASIGEGFGAALSTHRGIDSP